MAVSYNTIKKNKTLESFMGLPLEEEEE